MNKIKVLFAIGNLNLGGAEKLVINQIKNIDQTKFEPHLCTLFPVDKKNYPTKLPDVSQNYRQFFFRGPWDVISWIKLFIYLRHEKFDILCCHLFESNFIIRLLNLFVGVKTVFIFEHNIYWKKQWWKILADRLLTKKTAKIFVDSQAILNFTSDQEKISKEKFAILPYPIELAEQKQFDPEKIKRDFSLPLNSFVIGSVARFVQQKGQTYLIKAAAKILKRLNRQDIYFLLVGYGHMEQELKKLIDSLNIRQRVIVSPAVDIKEVLPIINIYVISSLWEGQPIAMLEAMAAGCPVVATNVGGVPEILIDGKNGLIVEPKDEVTLAAALIRLIENKNLRDNLGKAAKLTAVNYSMPIYIKKLEEYFIAEYIFKNKH